jgi:hypothetical protein
MRYPKFRRQHLFVGSGVIEAGCKTDTGSRLKQSGMFWTVRGANAIVAVRYCQLNGEFEDYWEARRAACLIFISPTRGMTRPALERISRRSFAKSTRRPSMSKPGARPWLHTCL